VRFPLTVLLALAALAAPLATPAHASDGRVSIRVEGKTTTLFGTDRPLVTPVTGRLTATDSAGQSVRVEVAGPTVLGALEAASRQAELYYHMTAFSFGNLVDQVGRFGGSGTAGWAFKVNGKQPRVGADQAAVKDGDAVLWYWAPFGTKTLELVADRRCMRAVARDDAGRTSRPANVVFEVDGRRVAAAQGRWCGAWTSLRAVKRGYVRSETSYAG
jgi:hypothetical protein